MEQNCKLFCLPLLAFSLISFYSSAQFVKAIKPGVYFSYGYSKARQPLSEIARNQQSSIQQRFASGGVYFNFILDDRSSRKQLSILRYAKLDILFPQGQLNFRNVHRPTLIISSVIPALTIRHANS